ncbi:MAG: hypothetical protein JST93_29125 [Acidobacteria bacterium]|nr:hypothetical protein [Acidobacteriota bacterium]
MHPWESKPRIAEHGSYEEGGLGIRLALLGTAGVVEHGPGGERKDQDTPAVHWEKAVRLPVFLFFFLFLFVLVLVVEIVEVLVVFVILIVRLEFDGVNAYNSDARSALVTAKRIAFIQIFFIHINDGIAHGAGDHL